MIIAVATGQDGEKTSPVFGRCMKFRIFKCKDNETGDPETMDNPGYTAPGGAGIQAAQFLIDMKVDAVIAGNFGPKAASILKTSKIRMMQSTEDSGKALEKALNGSLAKVNSHTVEEHFGSRRGRGRHGRK